MLKRKLTAEETVPEPVALDLWSLATNGTQEGRFLSLPKESPRFLTSISQILVIFEPDSNLDTKIRKIDIVPLYHCTISKIDFAPLISSIDLYILLYILQYI